MPPSPSVGRKNNKLVVAIAAIVTVLVILAGSFGGYMALKSYYPGTQVSQLQETRTSASSNPKGLLHAVPKGDNAASESAYASSPPRKSSSQEDDEYDPNYGQLSEGSMTSTLEAASRTCALTGTSSSSEKSPAMLKSRRSTRGSTAALVALVLIFVSILLTAIGLIGYKVCTDKLEQERLAAEAAERERRRQEELERQRQERAAYLQDREAGEDHHELSFCEATGTAFWIFKWAIILMFVFVFFSIVTGIGREDVKEE